MVAGRRWMMAIAAASPLLTGAAWAQADIQSEERRSAVEANAIAQRNAAIIRRYIDFTNRHDVDAAVQFFADDTVNHGAPTGPAGVERVLTDIYATFPDWRMEIVDLVAVGDDVVVREIVSGTHRGTGRIAVNGGLLVDAPPTGKRFIIQQMHWYTFNKDGLIVRARANRDDVGMMQHLGLLPMPPGGRRDLPPNPNDQPRTTSEK
jgi:predicted ester cyclase